MSATFVAAAARRAGSTPDTTWTLAGWIAATPTVSEALARALLKARPMHQTELEFARSLGGEAGGGDRMLSLLSDNGALDALANELSTSLGRLASANAATAITRVRMLEGGGWSCETGCESTRRCRSSGHP